MNCFERALGGHFYAVGVGPGSPDLLTVRAVSIVRTARVIVAPRSENSAESLALSVVRPLLDDQEIVEQVYPMARDQARTFDCWNQMAHTVARRCEVGDSVAHLTIGDPLIYSTGSYLLQCLADRLAPECIHVVPGIGAFQASAAILGEPLTLQDDRLMLVPATHIEDVERALDSCETLVIYKIGSRLPAIADLLARRGLLDRARMVSYAEQPGKEAVVTHLASAAAGYMSTIIVRTRHRKWSPAE